MSSSKDFPKGTIVLLASFLFLLIFIFISQSPAKKMVPKDLIAVLRPIASPLKPFSLVDKNEQTFTHENFKDKWSFVFFGYTHCPDICPTTLVTLKHINKALEKYPHAKSNFQVVFVSVDPERDTPKSLASYVSFFNKDFIAVTGHAEKLKAFAKQFSAAYIKEASNTPGDYLMSHTSSIFLVSPKAELVASFSPPLSVDTITAQYLKIHSMN